MWASNYHSLIGRHGYNPVQIAPISDESELSACQRIFTMFRELSNFIMFSPNKLMSQIYFKSIGLSTAKLIIRKLLIIF